MISMKNKVSAYTSAVAYLARVARTEFEIRRYLTKKSYSEEEIGTSINDLKSERVIDDESYSHDFTEFSIKNRLLGPNAIRLRLRRRGVSSDIVSKTLSALYPEELVKDVALASAKKKLVDVRAMPKQKQMEKVGRFLASRGFPEGVIWDTLNNLGLSE